MTEADPVQLNVEESADYWASLKVDAVQVSVTGILAYCPSAVPFHKHGKFLNGLDFFGDCLKAAKKRNLRVLARMSPDLQWEDALTAHPSGSSATASGKFVAHSEETRLYRTCMFSTYYSEHIPAIMREVIPVRSRRDFHKRLAAAWQHSTLLLRCMQTHRAVPDCRTLG